MPSNHPPLIVSHRHVQMQAAVAAYGPAKAHDLEMVFGAEEAVLAGACEWAFGRARVVVGIGC